MEELIEEIKSKRIRTKRESSIYSLYGELSVYSSDEVTSDTKLILISRVINLDKLIYLNMRILAAALVVLYILSLDNLRLNKDNFHSITNTYIKKYFTGNFESIQIDIFRYIRHVLSNEIEIQ